MKNTIGDRIRKCRLNKGLSQDYVASLLDLSPSALSNIETNKSEITVNRLYKIAEILEVNINTLLGNEAIVNNYSTSESKSNHLLEDEVKQLKIRMEQIETTMGKIEKNTNKKYSGK